MIVEIVTVKVVEEGEHTAIKNLCLRQPEIEKDAKTIEGMIATSIVITRWIGVATSRMI